MKKACILAVSLLLALALTACGNEKETNTPSTDSTSASLTAEYPYQADLDGNSDILILAKSEEALNEFVVRNAQDKAQDKIDTALSDLDEVQSTKNSEAITIEKAEFEFSDTSYTYIYLTVRNNLDESVSTIAPNVDFIDENGDVIDVTYPSYDSVLEPGQSCRIEASYDGIPYGIRIASANMFNSKGDEIINVKFDTPFVAKNPNA